MPINEGLRTVLLLSGGGSTAEAIVKATQDGGVLAGKIHPIGAIASSSEAGGIKRLGDLGIEVAVFDRKSLGREAFAEAVAQQLEAFNPDLVSQNGWTPRTPQRIVERYTQEGRLIVNQHPAPLDPGRIDSLGRKLDFGGKGMHGRAPTAAALAYNWALDTRNPYTESSVHLVTPVYDDGQLIRVARMPIPTLAHTTTIDELVTDGDLQYHLQQTTDRTQKELIKVEHTNVIYALERLAVDGPSTFERAEPLIAPGTEAVLFAAKDIGTHLYPHG